jgi:CRISPR-associated protein Cas1
MRLVVDGFGKYLGIENGLIAVKEKGKALRKVRPEDLKQVLIIGKAAISSDAIKLLLRNRVDVVFLDFNGSILGRLSHPLIGTAKTRREQYLAYNDRRGVHLAKEFVRAKMANQMAILTNLAKARKGSNPEMAESLLEAKREIDDCLNELDGLEAERIDDVRERLLGIEGKASKQYWDALSLVIPEEYRFNGRRGIEIGSPRYARDIVNAMLNYGYSILLAECVKAVELVGLDPYAGFLHVDVSGRSSLAIDLMENFRQQVVDRVVLRLISYKQIKSEDCEERNMVCQLSDNARRLLLASLLERLDSKTQYRGRNLAYSSIILLHARDVVAFLRGERRYEGFVQKW